MAEGGDAPLKLQPPPQFKYEVVCRRVDADAEAFVLAAKPLWKKQKTHTTTPLTGRASTEVCKTVKVYVNNEINTYVSFFFATHCSIIIQMCFGLKNSSWIWV